MWRAGAVNVRMPVSRVLRVAISSLKFSARSIAAVLYCATTLAELLVMFHGWWGRKGKMNSNGYLTVTMTVVPVGQGAGEGWVFGQQVAVKMTAFLSIPNPLPTT